MIRLSAQQERFLAAYVKNGNRAKAAYREVYDCEGLTDYQVSKRAYELINMTRVATAIRQMRQKALELVEIQAADVLREWIAIATTDANEVVQFRRLCCRFCHGKRHAYQWRDEEEYAIAVADATDDHATQVGVANVKGVEPPPLKLPDASGGFGFRFNAVPHLKCPRCLGEGRPELFIPDSRFMSPAAKRLYAGIKQTKDGVQVLMHSKMDALDRLAKYMEMLKPADPAANLIGNRPLSGDVPVTIDAPVPRNATDAASFYRTLMRQPPELPAPAP